MYICHYCVDYKTNNLGDLYRHYKRKTKCKCSTIYLYEEAEKLSKNKKFNFTFDTKNLSKNDFIYIITHFIEKDNTINKNYMFNNNIISNIENNNLTKNNYYIENKKNNNENNINEEEINEKEIDEEDTEPHMCLNCNKEFSSIYSLKRHYSNSNACKKNQELNKIRTIQKKYDLILKKNKEKEKDLMNQNINNTFINNVHNNNVQNINNSNVQNNNNNTQNSTYNVSIRDFVNDSYDLSHINDSYYQKKDFFLYHNFLKMIMENKNNQNIFFSENEAIMYSDNELNKMSSDKAGYLILDKLSQSFDEFLYKQDSEAREYYKFITKYYHVVKGHYKHDTIFKEYDVDEQRFIYTANSNLFRSRDKYLSKMVTTLGKVRGSTLENMSVNIDELKDIPMLNPNIEDFASVKMRYRDLKDKD